MNVTAKSKRLQLEQELLEIDRIYRARNGLLGFTTFTKRDYEVNWHHKLTCKYLNAFVRKEIPRLMIFQPPRHGKSELTSRRLPAYLFGRYPRTSIIGTSYAADLASRMNRDVQRIIDSDDYKRLFPGVCLSGDNVRPNVQGSWLRNSDIFEIVGHGGTYRSAGVGGGITGMGGEWLLIDDPIKNQEEADSEVYRNKLWEWYTSTLYTRLEKNGSILVTLTRWHEDDLAGRLLDLAKNDPEADQWVVLNLPAICEEGKHPEDPREIGQSLWPEKYSEKRLAQLRASVGSRVYNALYQQRPSAAEGAIIKRGWIQYYRALPARLDEMIQSWDFTFKDTATSAYVCGQVWGRHGANKYLIHEVRARMDFIGSVNAMLALSAKFPKCTAKLVEEKANGAAIISMLKAKLSGIVPVNPEGSKDARIYSVQPEYEAGNVYYPDPSIAPWIGDHVEELCGFPTAKFRDRVDTVSQALKRLRESGNAVFTKDHIPNKISSITSSIRGAETW